MAIFKVKGVCRNFLTIYFIFRAWNYIEIPSQTFMTNETNFLHCTLRCSAGLVAIYRPAVRSGNLPEISTDFMYKFCTLYKVDLYCIFPAAKGLRIYSWFFKLLTTSLQNLCGNMDNRISAKFLWHNLFRFFVNKTGTGIRIYILWMRTSYKFDYLESVTNFFLCNQISWLNMND